MKIIAFSGKSGSGKDFITTNYLRPQGYFPVSLATHFKIWIVGKREATYEEVFHTKPEPVRHLLQQEGTERGRDVYGSSIWVDTLFEWMHWWNEMWSIDKFCIMDCRFQTEVYDIRKRGGKIYRIHAPLRAASSTLSENARLHISEIDLDTFYNFDGIIHNDPNDASTIEEQLKILKLI